MSKIYVVRCSTGEGVDYTESLMKAFYKAKDAEKYADKFEKQELHLREMAERCKNCSGKDNKCPLYVASMFKDDDCDNYEPYHINSHYWIEDVEIVGEKHGKTVQNNYKQNKM